MDITLYNKLGDELKEKFFAFCAEYLPGSEPEKMKRYEKMFPQAFLAVTDKTMTKLSELCSAGAGKLNFPKINLSHLTELR